MTPLESVRWRLSRDRKELEELLKEPEKSRDKNIRKVFLEARLTTQIAADEKILEILNNER